jgi:hypothetical protein
MLHLGSFVFSKVNMLTVDVYHESLALLDFHGFGYWFGYRNDKGNIFTASYSSSNNDIIC